MTTLTIYYGAAKPMKAVGAIQCRLLAFAEKYRVWHTFKNDRSTMRSVKSLQAKGYLIVEGDQFKFTNSTSLLTK